MLHTKNLDKIILLLLTIILLVDSVNGFFLNKGMNIPISQAYKAIILVLMLFRLVGRTYELLFVFSFFICLSIGPILGFITHFDTEYLLSDIIKNIKWINIIVSFFYFKSIFNTSYSNSLDPIFKKIITFSVIIILANLFLGLLGFGTAFYNHGYGNAAGTKGFFYAGNELSVLILILMSFIMYYFLDKSKLRFYFYSALAVLMSFIVSSKLLVLGMIIIFARLYFYGKVLTYSTIKKIMKMALLFLPIFIYSLYYIITKTSMLLKLEHSFRVNNNEYFTILMSNRNNFVKWGMDEYIYSYSFIEKLFGIGQSYYVEKATHVAEIDVFTLLFSNGIISLLFHLFFVIYLFLQAKKLSLKPNKYIYAKYVLFMVIFLTVLSNFAGHIYNSGIAGIFIGMLFASMFYTPNNKKTAVYE